MDRIIGSGTTDIGGGRRGFRDEDLPTGTQGTVVTAAFLNAVQEELLKVIEEAGIVPSSADWTQLSAAIKSIGGAANRFRWLAVISMTTTAPPAGAADGDCYLIPTGATGAWATKAGQIAEKNSIDWRYYVPPNGHGVALTDGRVFVRVGGTYVEKVALDAQSGKWNYAVAAGTVNALTATLNPVPVSLASIIGAMIIVKTGANPNTAAMTLNLNAFGAKSIVHADGSAIAAGEVPAGTMLALIYDGTNFVAFSAYVAPSDATDALKGVVELATPAETITGTDAARAVTPAGLAALTATDTRNGLIELATSAEVITGTDATRAVTPAGLTARTATDARTGLVELATSAETITGTDAARAVTPAGLAALTATETRSGLVELATVAEARAGAATGVVVTPAGLAAAIADMSYSGSDANNMVFPIGTSIFVDTGNTFPTRASSVVIQANAGNDYSFAIGSGTYTLAGTWRARGTSGFATSTNNDGTLLMERVA